MSSPPKHLDFIQFTIESTHKNHTIDEDTIIMERITDLNYTIDSLIVLGVPETKIVIGIRNFGGFEKEILSIVAYREKCGLKFRDIRREYEYASNIRCEEPPMKLIQIISSVNFETGTSIANQIRLLMKRNLAGVMVFA